MSFTKKRPTFLRFVFTIFLGLIASGGILMLVQQFYQKNLEQSALREPFFCLTGISALVIALFLVFPANKPFRLFKWLWRLLILGVVVVLLWGVGGFYIAQNDLLYMPGRRELQAEAFLKEQADVEAVQITGENQEVYEGYLWKTAPGQAGLVLYFGGNGELAAGRISELKRNNAQSFLAGYHFMMVDYPGYGNSGGEPTEESILNMAQLAYDAALAREDVDGSKIILAGWSLGSGSASYLAANNQAAGLILMTPFYNGAEMVNTYLEQQFQAGSAVKTLASLLVRNKYPNEVYAKTVSANARVLVLGARQDSQIPYQQAERLASHFPNGEFVLLEGLHHAPWVEQRSLEAMKALLDAVNTQ